MTEIPLKGYLRNVSLPKILAYLNRIRATGTLLISTHGITKRVYLSKGNAIFASSTYEDDRLGEMLIKAGKITVEQYDKSVEMLKKTGQRQGAILVNLGFLTPKDLFWGVKYQVREIIYSLFQFEDSEYEFVESETTPDEMITLKMSMGNLIYEGVKRIENWTRIRREMPDTDAVMKLSDDPLSLFQEVELTAQDRKILSLIDGKRSIKKTIEDSWLNSFEALKILYLLWSIGIITETVAAVQEKVAVSVEEILAPVSEEEEAFMTKVNNIYERLGSMSFFELINVPESADSEAVRKNYYALAKEFHPDRFYDSADTTIKDKLSQIFDFLTDAYNTLKDEEGRKRYLSSLGRLEAPSDMGGEKAEKNFKQAIGLIKSGDFVSAVKILKEAVEISPDNPEYWNYLSLSMSKIPQGLQEAEGAMLEAIRLEPTSSEYYANLGLLYLKAKRMDEAKKQFHKALALDPDNQRAKKALSQIKG
ncbi:MAG: tetratricopeptide repeat protein [Nitrospirae bacterium]|nr:tetratricopeptide repeat protein [Nitrospirota bacterium]